MLASSVIPRSAATLGVTVDPGQALSKFRWVIQRMGRGCCVSFRQLRTCRGTRAGRQWANKRVRRETGKEQVVQVHCDEGVAVRQAKLAGSSR